MNKKNIGLIINGAFASFKEFESNNVSDSNKNIIKLLNNFSNLFIEIILVTWKSEKKKIDLKILTNKILATD